MPRDEARQEPMGPIAFISTDPATFGIEPDVPSLLGR